MLAREQVLCWREFDETHFSPIIKYIEQNKK